MEDHPVPTRGKRPAASADNDNDNDTVASADLVVTPETGNNKNNTNKKTRKNSPVGEHLLCPITLELPVDPVMAEDGFTYERGAMVEHLRQQIGGNNGHDAHKSPMTNEPMGIQLISATLVAKLIQFHIENGDIEGPLAESWTKRKNEKNELDELKRRAEDEGDHDPEDAAFKVAIAYYEGGKGVNYKDEKEAIIWFKKAADLGSMRGMGAAAALMLDQGHEPTNAVVLMAMAAQGSSDRACVTLAEWYIKGKYGLAKDYGQAKRLLQKVVNGNNIYCQISEDEVEEARKLLEELP